MVGESFDAATLLRAVDAIGRMRGYLGMVKTASRHSCVPTCYGYTNGRWTCSIRARVVGLVQCSRPPLPCKTRFMN